MAFNKIVVKNTEHVPHKDHENPQFIKGTILVKKFANIIKDTEIKREFLMWNSPSYIRTINKNLYTHSVNKDTIAFNKSRLSQLIIR